MPQARPFNEPLPGDGIIRNKLMKRTRKEDPTPTTTSSTNPRRGLALPACALLPLLLGALPSAGQGGVTPPHLQNCSILRGTNTATMRIWVPTQAGANYTAEFKSQLGSGLWSQFTNFSGSGSSDPIFDNIAGISKRFYRAAVDPRPWIRSQPPSRNPYAGEAIQLDVLATGMLPLAYQWSGPSGIITDSSRVAGSTTAHLLISGLNPGDVGNYSVTVTNAYGTTSSVPAGVRITLSQAPRILIDPQTQTLTVGQTVSLWSTASGAATLAYRWYGPAGLLSDSDRVTGTATTNLTVTSLQVIDDGGYFMVVSNSFGATTSAVATVRVQLGQAPRINTDPLSQTVIAGQTANLSVVATGTGTLNYEWHGPSGILSNGGKISGATTANLAISNFQVTENGDYFVVVTNTFGTATSGTANVRAQ